MEECVSLDNDFLRQSKLEPKPEIAKFSIIIHDLYLAVQDCHDGTIAETKLRQVIKNHILPKVEKYFID